MKVFAGTTEPKSSIEDITEDDLGPIPTHINAYGKPTRFEKRTPTDRAEVLYTEDCGQCKGRGRFYSYSGRDVGTCFKCNGTGKLTFKTPKATRDANKIKSAERKEAKIENNIVAFEAQYPQIKAWWTGSTFEFAIAMRDAVSRFGSLTEKQLAAALKCTDALAAKRAETQEAITNAPAVNVSGISEAFNTAFKKGIKRPKMRVLAGEHRLVLSRAPDNGKNAGAIYVKDRDSDAYLGKVLNNKFFRSYACDNETADCVVDVCRDPLEAAVAYGKLLGECSVCGRTLTDPVSIANGIGPICQDKLFG